MQTADELNELMVKGATRVSGDRESGPVIEVAHGGHHASISLFGAHLMHWRPAGQHPVLWLSDGAHVDQERPIRGGVPVCWPWFAGHQCHADWPAHGFARTTRWLLDFVAVRADAVDIQFSLPRADWHAPFWPEMTRPVMRFSIGGTLDMALATENIDPHEIEFSEALHTYFAVSDIGAVSIHGLEQVAYVDKLACDGGLQERPPDGRGITIDGEFDRIYQGIEGPIALHDGRLRRTVTVAHRQAGSAIVWNPWTLKSARMGDMGPADAYRGMVCIETGNVAARQVVLAPGETHTLMTTIAVTKEQ